MKTLLRALIVLDLLIVCAIMHQARVRRANTADAQAFQEKFLKSCFTEIRQQDGKVFFLVTRDRRWLMRTADSEDGIFSGRILISVGGHFRESDRHAGTNYTLQSTDAEGVTLAYYWSSAFHGENTGTVKLPWRNASSSYVAQ